MNPSMHYYSARDSTLWIHLTHFSREYYCSIIPTSSKVTEPQRWPLLFVCPSENAKSHESVNEISRKFKVMFYARK
jgi:hypothetical protein